MYVENHHIQEWIGDGNAVVLPVKISEQLSSYLDYLPWNLAKSGLDWERLNGIKVDISTFTDEEVLDWVGSTPLKNDPYIIFLFSPDEPCLACPFKFGAYSIPAAFWLAPGRNYVFGATRNETGWHPNLEHLIEYNGTHILIAAEFGGHQS